MNIRIDVPYAQPECVPIWARQEDQIDFRTDRECADRCTLSHAADELKRFLERTLKRPFDTWGSCCTCPHCRALGNDTDQYLFSCPGFEGKSTVPGRPADSPIRSGWPCACFDRPSSPAAGEVNRR